MRCSALVLMIYKETQIFSVSAASTVFLRAALPTTWDSIYSAFSEEVGARPKLMDLPTDIPLRYCIQEKIREGEEVRKVTRVQQNG